MRGSLNTRMVRQTNEGGSHFRSGAVSVKYLPRNEYRYTPVVSKKQGNAVKRNRVKRVIRGIMSSQGERFPRGYYLIYYRGFCIEMNRNLLEKNLDTIAMQLSKSEETKTDMPRRREEKSK